MMVENQSDDANDFGGEGGGAAILEFLQDEIATTNLLDHLNRKSGATSTTITALFSRFRDFPGAFLAWVTFQSQPFVTYSDHDANENDQPDNVVPSPFKNGASESMCSQKDNKTGTANNHTARILSNEVGDAKLLSKPKKRMTTNAISLVDGSALIGNISSAPNSAILIGSSSTTTTVPIKLNKFSEGLSSAPSSDSKNTVEFNRIGTARKVPETRKKASAYSVHLIPSPIFPPSVKQAVVRMSNVLILLILNQHVTFADAVPLLARLSSLSLPGPSDALQVIITVEEINKFPTLLLSSELCHVFTVRVLEGLLPVIKMLGDPIVLAFAESPVLQRFASTMASDLMGVADDTRGAELSEDICFSLSNHFIQPFREEIDSRNEYKTPIEVAAYNQREKCYDNFSNLLHSYQTVSRSDVDGSKTLEFWQSVLPIEGPKILSLKDCNFTWFGNIFMQMLLFYGSNTTLSASSFSKSDPRGHGNDINPLTSTYPIIPKGPTKSGAPNPGVSSNLGTIHPVVDSNKQRKLEERMGPGGLGYQTGVQKSQPLPRTGKSVYQGKTPRTPLITDDLYGEPALHFSGNQQFFFRFIVQMDNHRFCRCLEEVIAAEIKDLTQLSDADVNMTSSSSSSDRRNGRKNNAKMSSSSSGDRIKSSSSSTSTTTFDTNTDTEETFTSSSSSSSSSSHKKSFSRDDDLEGISTFDSKQYSSTVQSFAFRIVKLRILGRFLGLLTFWPTWSLQVSPKDRGPLILLATNAARIRGSLRSSAAYPLRNILEQAWINNRLAFTVPWVTEFLKLIVWDCTYVQAHNPYRDVFGLLRGMQRSKLLHPVDGKPSSNRLYVLIEIQNLWSAVPLQDIRIIPLPIIRGEKNGKSHFRSGNGFEIDDENTAFTLTFLNHVTLFLNEALKIFKKRKRINLAKRISQVNVFSLPSSTYTSASTSTSIAAVQFANTKRQTPNLIGSLHGTEDTLIPFGAVQNYSSSPSPQCFKSPISIAKNLSCVLSGDANRIRAGSTGYTEDTVDHGGGRVATSLLAQFTATTHTVPVKQPRSANFAAPTFNTTIAAVAATTLVVTAAGAAVPLLVPKERDLAVNSDLTSLEDRMTRCSNRMRSSSSGSSDRNHVHLLGVSTNNAGSSSTESTVKIKNRISPVLKKAVTVGTHVTVQTVNIAGLMIDPLVTPTLTGALIGQGTLIRSISSPGPELGPGPGQGMGMGPGVGTGQGKGVGTGSGTETAGPMWKITKDLTLLTDRLEVAFWQQHPQLQNMSGFLLEQTQKACHAHLRDRVAQSVRTLWGLLAVLRGVYDEKINEFNLLLSEKDPLLSKGEDGCRDDINNLMNAFYEAVEVEKETVHTSTVSDAKKFLNSFIQTHLSVALPELCALHPCHVRVTSLAVQLIHKQASEQHGALMIFLSSYCARKLREVSELSTKQFKKAARSYLYSVPKGISENENENKSEKENEKEHGDLRPSIPLQPPPSLNGHNTRDNNTHRPRVDWSTNRRMEISNILNEINLFFTITDHLSGSAVPLDDVIVSSDDVTVPTHPIEISSFISTVHNVRCLGVRDCSISDRKFQNGLVQISELLHALVESVTACVGDYMGQNNIARNKAVVDEKAFVKLDADADADADSDAVVKREDFPTLLCPGIKHPKSLPVSVPMQLRTTTPVPWSVPVPISAPSPSPSAVPVSCTSWSSIASRNNLNGLKVPADDRNVLEQLPNNTLTHTELMTMIENTRRLLLSMIVWANTTKISTTVTTFQGLEVAGKLSIQIVRLLTQCMPSLIYWDVFLYISLSGLSTGTPPRLEWGSGPDRGPESGMGTGLVGLGLKDREDNIDNIEDWEAFLGMKKGVSCCSKEHSLHPSDVLLTATSLRLISMESMIFIITTAARPSSLNYFSSCKYLPYLIENGPIIVMRLIGRYLLSRIITECRRLRDNDSNSSLDIIIAVGISVFDGMHSSSGGCVWVKDPQVRNWMNQNVDPELVNLLLKLYT